MAPMTPGVGGPDHRPAGVLLQGPEDRVVAEGAPLDHDGAPQGVQIGNADDLGKDVLDNGPAQAGHDVPRQLAVALLGDDAAVHKDSAPAAQAGGLLGVEGRPGDLVHRDMQGGGKVLQEGPAAGGTGLVDHDVGDDPVGEPDGLHILTADVQHEGGVGDVLGRRPGVGHRLHHVALGGQGVGEQLLPIAGGAHPQDLQLGPRRPIAVPQLQQGLPGHVQGRALVGGVEGVQNAFFLVQKDEFGGGAPRVDAQPGPHLLPRVEPDGLPGGEGVGLGKGQLLAATPEEGLGGAVLLGLQLQRPEGLQQPVQPHLGLPAGVQGLQRQGGPVGHHQLRVLGDQDVLIRQAQPLGKHLDQGGVEGEGPALEGHGLFDLQSLGQTADGLLGDGVEGGQGQILLGHALVQQGLDVGLGVHTAPAGHVVDAVPPGGQGVELLDGHVENGGHLVDKGPGAAGAAAVHAHIRHLQLPGGLAGPEENDLGVLSPQLDGGAHVLIFGAQGDGVGHHLLDIGQPQPVGQLFRPRARHGQMALGVGEACGQLAQGGGHALHLVGVVPLIVGVDHPVEPGIQGGDLGGGGTDVDPDVQNGLVSVHVLRLCSGLDRPAGRRENEKERMVPGKKFCPLHTPPLFYQPRPPVSKGRPVKLSLRILRKMEKETAPPLFPGKIGAVPPDFQ